MESSKWFSTIKATLDVVKLKKSILSIKLASDKINLWETQQKQREGINQKDRVTESKGPHKVIRAATTKAITENMSL